MIVSVHIEIIVIEILNKRKMKKQKKNNYLHT